MKSIVKLLGKFSFEYFGVISLFTELYFQTYLRSPLYIGNLLKELRY